MRRTIWTGAAAMILLGLAGVTPLSAGSIVILGTGIGTYDATGPGGAFTPVVVSDPTSIIPQSPAGSSNWVANQAGGLWIGPVADQSNHIALDIGIYTFTTTFDVGSLILNTVSLSGNWAADGMGTEILVNGRATGIMTAGPRPSFEGLNAYSISNANCLGGCFQSGMNTLTFRVNNGGFETGLLATVSGSGSTSTPEPGTWILLGSGMALLGLGRWRKKRV